MTTEEMLEMCLCDEAEPSLNICDSCVKRDREQSRDAALDEAMRAMAFPCKAKDVHHNHDVCECCHAKFIAIRALKRGGK